MENLWAGKNVLITGVSGTVGRELLRQVASRKPAKIIGLDNNETELFFVCEEYRNHPNVHLYLGDMRDCDKLMRKMRGVDIVLHATALKHVILCEQSPRDGVQTNILGTQNVIDAALANNVEHVIFTSSDKAVNPTNVMGTTKLMGERLITAVALFPTRIRPKWIVRLLMQVVMSRRTSLRQDWSASVWCKSPTRLVWQNGPA